MNKIYSGIVALVVMTTVVAGSAYALFASQVEINGITLGTTSSGLLVKLGAEGDNEYATSREMETAFQLAPLSPGETSTPGVFFLRNNGEVDLNLSAKITSAQGDWGVLSTVLEGVTCTGPAIQGTSPNFTGCDTSDTANSTGWANLAYWNANDVPLPGGSLAVWNNIANPGSNDRMYVSFYRLPSSADNSVADKEIEDLVIQITGTQATP